jgi:hypothetical protein
VADDLAVILRNEREGQVAGGAQRAHDGRLGPVAEPHRRERVERELVDPVLIGGALSPDLHRCR